MEYPTQDYYRVIDISRFDSDIQLTAMSTINGSICNGFLSTLKKNKKTQILYRL